MTAAEFSHPAAFLATTRDVQGIVTRAVSGARAAGRDYMAQTRAAAAAVIAVRPDLSLRQALDAVTRLRDFGDT